MLYKHGRTLLSRDSDDTATDDATSDVVHLTDDTPEDKQSYGVAFSFTLADGTAPTLDASLLTSWDNEHFVEAAAMTQLTANGSTAEFTPVEALGPYNKAVVTGGGTAKALWHGSVRVVATNRVRTIS